MITAAGRASPVMRRQAVAIFTAAVTALTISGCGGASTLSARELRAQAGARCESAVRRSDRIAMPRSNSGGAAFLEQGIAIFRSELAALRKLVPPRKLAGAYRIALGDSAQQLDALIATERYLHGGGDPVVAIKQLDVELGAIDARDRAAWTAVGVAVCTNLAPGTGDQAAPTAKG